MLEAPPTLVVFYLGERRERERRRLLPARFADLEHRLYRRCLDQVIEAGRDNRCRVVVVAPAAAEVPPGVERVDQVEGGSLGERIERGHQALGPVDGPLLLVAADAPGLDAAGIATALSLLDSERRAVVGPSPDGGFYLLGIHGALPHLGRVAWCTRRARVTLEEQLLAEGRSVRRLAAIRDIDSRRELAAILAAGIRPFAGAALGRALRSVLRSLASAFGPPRLRPLRLALASSPSRGPPTRPASRR